MVRPRLSDQRILAMVLAGGEGSRLHPLTAERSKPSVPFGGNYRIVDFVLSNLVNSGINSIYLLVQYKSQSLIDHVQKAWVTRSVSGDDFVTVVPPQMRLGPDWFQGTADAVYQNLNLIAKFRPNLVAVFGADHIYRMDVRQMVDFHLDNEADVTVAAVPVPLKQASAFGVIATDADHRIAAFQEKPKEPASMPGRPSHAYASTGNYLFNCDVIQDSLVKAHAQGHNDFGRDILPRMLDSHRVFAYDFATNTIPGNKSYEEQGYWRDVGTIDAYFAAHQDMLGAEARFDACNECWPIYSSNYSGPVARLLDGVVHNCVIGGGSVIYGASVKNSVIRRDVHIDPDVELEDCIIMDHTTIERGSRLKQVIVDRFNRIEAGTRIGWDHDADRQRYHVTDSGIVVMGRGRTHWRHCA